MLLCACCKPFYISKTLLFFYLVIRFITTLITLLILIICLGFFLNLGLILLVCDDWAIIFFILIIGDIAWDQLCLDWSRVIFILNYNFNGRSKAICIPIIFVDGVVATFLQWIKFELCCFFMGSAWTLPIVTSPWYHLNKRLSTFNAMGVSTLCQKNCSSTYVNCYVGE